MKRNGRRRKLDDAMKEKVLLLLKTGQTRSLAARYVGCSRQTLWNEGQHDPVFGEKMRHAELEHEATLLLNIYKASERSWRAAAWALERRNPREYARPALRPAEKSKQCKAGLGKADLCATAEFIANLVLEHAYGPKAEMFRQPLLDAARQFIEKHLKAPLGPKGPVGEWYSHPYDPWEHVPHSAQELDELVFGKPVDGDAGSNEQSTNAQQVAASEGNLADSNRAEAGTRSSGEPAEGSADVESSPMTNLAAGTPATESSAEGVTEIRLSPGEAPQVTQSASFVSPDSATSESDHRPPVRSYRWPSDIENEPELSHEAALAEAKDLLETLRNTRSLFIRIHGWLRVAYHPAERHKLTLMRGDVMVSYNGAQRLYLALAKRYPAVARELNPDIELTRPVEDAVNGEPIPTPW